MFSLFTKLAGGLGGWQMYAIIGLAVLTTVTGAVAYHEITVGGLERKYSKEKDAKVQCILDLGAVTNDRDGLRVTIDRQNAAVRALADARAQSGAAADLAAVEALRASDAAITIALASTDPGPVQMNEFLAGLGQ